METVEINELKAILPYVLKHKNIGLSIMHVSQRIKQ